MPNTEVVQWPCGCTMQYSDRSTDMTLVLRLLTWCPKHRIVTVLVGQHDKEKGGSDEQPRVSVSL